MVEKLTRFDAAAYLNTHEEMVAYRVSCFEEDNGDGILGAYLKIYCYC
ncbi:DNA-binding phage protein [Pseudomonas kilonensis]